VPESFKESWKDEVGYRGILPHLYASRRSFGSGGFPYFRTPCSHPIPSLKEPTCIGEGPTLWGPSRFEIIGLGRAKIWKALITGPSPA